MLKYLVILLSKYFEMYYNHNNLTRVTTGNSILYIDMNSYFASCEQQLQPKFRDVPIGVCPFTGNDPVIIAPSKEAKMYGVKTGMRFQDARKLCPQIIMVQARPVEYRKIHIQLMNILLTYCEDVIPRSIDEAVMNLTAYKYIYHDFKALALKIKEDIKTQIGEYVTCSIGISQNVFLAKLATEIHKPDGLIEITSDNIEHYLSKMQLTDLPGIAAGNEKRLKSSGIRKPIDLYNASESLLRKAFGGVVGNYWHYRLHFREVDLYTSSNKTMSAMRTLSANTRSSEIAMEGMLVSLCTKLEQRMVKSELFCRDIVFTTSYYDREGFKTSIKLQEPVQDAIDILQHIHQRIKVYQKETSKKVFAKNIRSMGVVVFNFVDAKYLQYSLFDNRMQKDILRKAVYNLKDRYGKNIVRKACETIEDGHLRDAIGFGSVKDIYQGSMLETGFNKYMLEEEVIEDR